MCEKTQINETNKQRSIWKQLGGDPDDINSKISVHEIAAQTPKVCFCSFPNKPKRELNCFVLQKTQFKRVRGSQFSESLSSHSRRSRHSEESSIDISTYNQDSDDDDDDEMSLSQSISSALPQEIHQNRRRKSAPSTPVLAPLITAESKKKAYYSEDESDLFQKRRIRRSQTAKSEPSILSKDILLSDALSLFEKYDLESNGTLTLNEFQTMLLELFKGGDDDKKFESEIVNTFLAIASPNALSFDYSENIYNLEEELKKFSGVPSKYQFLKLCHEIFGAQEEQKETETDFAQKQQSANPIDDAKKLKARFLENGIFRSSIYSFYF